MKGASPTRDIRATRWPHEHAVGPIERSQVRQEPDRDSQRHPVRSGVQRRSVSTTMPGSRDGETTNGCVRRPQPDCQGGE